MSTSGPNDPLIYDFGMNIAEDTEYYLDRGFRVVAVEADPAMCAKAAERFGPQIADGSLIIVNKAVGRQRGVFKFHVCDTMSAWSTASDELRDYWAAQGAKFRTIEVDFIDAGDLIADHGAPYYVKIDIEGHDQICLEQIRDAKILPAWLSFELDVKRSREAIATLRQMGYDSFALVDQSSVVDQRIDPASREGRYLDYRFRTGQSGKFGSDLDQPWVGHEQIAKQLRTLSWQGKAAKLLTMLGKILPGRINAATMFPSTQTWYDLHARKA